MYVNRAWVNISIACNLLKVYSSDYYAWVIGETDHKKKAVAEAELIAKIAAAHNASHHRFGYRGVIRYLKEHETNCMKLPKFS